MEKITRRSLLIGLGATAGLITAPSIVHAGNIMPVRIMAPTPIAKINPIRPWWGYVNGRAYMKEQLCPNGPRRLRKWNSVQELVDTVTRPPVFHYWPESAGVGGGESHWSFMVGERDNSKGCDTRTIVAHPMGVLDEELYSQSPESKWRRHSAAFCRISESSS